MEVRRGPIGKILNSPWLWILFAIISFGTYAFRFSYEGRLFPYSLLLIGAVSAIQALLCWRSTDS